MKMKKNRNGLIVILLGAFVLMGASVEDGDSKVIPMMSDYLYVCTDTGLFNTFDPYSESERLDYKKPITMDMEHMVYTIDGDKKSTYTVDTLLAMGRTTDGNNYEFMYWQSLCKDNDCINCMVNYCIFSDTNLFQLEISYTNIMYLYEGRILYDDLNDSIENQLNLAE